ncbi:MAG: aspartate-semialdehyde dehydrogenase [Candidatus Methylomirabilis sp.]|nr:aspartate-semialdehyde dehydrogenase [Deltaproteobacteria bacterium]
MAERTFNVAVVGATGAVGTEMIDILEERRFPVADLIPLASERSAGKRVEFRGRTLPVETLAEDSFRDVDIALFSAGGSVSAKFAPIAAKAGAVCIDNTSHFRMDPEAPLVVPEVNAHAIAEYKKKGIIANPNCSTIQMVLVLKPIHDAARIKRVIVSTYQATSGAGRSAMEELSKQTVSLMGGADPDALEVRKFPHRIAFNCIPQIDVFTENGYTKEEMKMTRETVKILGDEGVKVSATCVRVPVFGAHSESVNIETERKITPEEVRALLEKAPGLKIVDDPGRGEYPMNVFATGRDETFVGRIREDFTIPNGLNCWIVSDNIRKGAALNAVQIAEILIQKHL